MSEYLEEGVKRYHVDDRFRASFKLMSDLPIAMTCIYMRARMVLGYAEELRRRRRAAESRKGASDNKEATSLYVRSYSRFLNRFFSFLVNMKTNQRGDA